MSALLYPRRCRVCGSELEAEEAYLCSRCLSDLPLTYFWSWRGNPAERILWGRAHLDKVCSLFFYSRDNAYSSLTRSVKYGREIALGRYLGEMLGRYMTEDFRDVDYLVPVPLHWRRKWRRGYNQAEIIAEGISVGLGGVPILRRLLRRKKYAASQTRMSMGSKWENVEAAFILGREKKKALEGCHLLLVDDVLTSGATSEVCYDVLSSIKDVKVSAATLAFVQK